MPVPPSDEAQRLVSTARRSGRDLIKTIRDASLSGVQITLLCEQASAAIDRFCEPLLDDLLTTAHPAGEADAEWVKQQYRTLLTEFAISVRDAVQDAQGRHALAQTIQCQILQQEHRLRTALASTLGKPAQS